MEGYPTVIEYQMKIMKRLSKASNLMLIFETCNQEESDVVCQSEAKIKEWMVFKYIAVLSN